MAQDPSMAFAQNLVNKFLQFKVLQLQQQRYDEQLRLDRERNSLYTRNIESLITSRGRPERGTVPWFKGRGYSEEESQLGQDIAVGLAPRRMTPAQQLTAGKLMLDNAITIEGQQAGQQMMNDAMGAVKAQRGFPLSPKETPSSDTTVFPSGETEPISDLTEQPLFLQGMKEVQPDAGMFDRLNELRPRTGEDIIGTLKGTPNQRAAIDAVVGRALSTEQKQTLIDQILRGERIRVKDNAGKIGTIPIEELSAWLAIGGNTLAIE